MIFGVRSRGNAFAAATSLSLVLLLPVSGWAKADEANEQPLSITVDGEDGSYTIGAPGLDAPVLHAAISAQIDGHWLHSGDYPKRTVHQSDVSGLLGEATEWDVIFSGLPDEPELVYRLRAYAGHPCGEIQAIVRNVGRKPIQVESIRAIDATGSSILYLGGHADQDRILSDSFSEDVPPIKIRDLKDAEDHLHRGVGSQLVYNRQTQWSFFAGALTSDRFLTILRLHLNSNGDAPGIAAFEADSTGTTEITKENSLVESPLQDQIALSLPLGPGEDLSSERLLFSVGKDYHQQLETYGSLIKQIHHARTSAPTAMGWWSWTAYYYGLTEGAALTNAQWMAEHLTALGFTYFHLDEGYQFARGEYTTPDATLFPHGVAALEDKVRALGLNPGIWTAPFEVSERSSIYLEHPDWLVKNVSGQPIHLGWANDHHDRLYVLDVTHPDAQEYLRTMYAKLVRDWGIRYIKLDFMDDSSVEGFRYRPNTTAMEAQRIGLELIRQTVGDEVLLDKDGSAMLNPVGYVDYGRIAQDTGHTFTATREAAPAVAARYYMNRNFFVTDPDAFTVSTQTIKDHAWNGGKLPLTLDEAKVSIALSAVAGSMFEIGDDLPTLGSSPERLALVENRDLLNMVKLGHASIPVDLMTYAPADEQPSIFFLKEDERQSILTVFNWTDKPRAHAVELASLGLDANADYSISDILDDKATSRIAQGVFSIDQPGHSVRMFKIVNPRIRAQRSDLHVDHPSHIKAGKVAEFSVHENTPDAFATGYTWTFGDGVSLTGIDVTHAYTQSGKYRVTVRVEGLDGDTTENTFDVVVDGSIPSVFVPSAKTRFVEK